MTGIHVGLGRQNGSLNLLILLVAEDEYEYPSNIVTVRETGDWAAELKGTLKFELK